MSLGHHQNMTGEMRTLRVQNSLGPMPRLQLPLLRLFAALAWQPAFAVATRASPPNRDAALLSARRPHLAAPTAISAPGAGVHLRSSLLNLLIESPANGAAHMNAPGPQRPSQDESTGHHPPKVAPPSHHQNVSHGAERNASLNHQSFAAGPGFMASVGGANISATRRQEQRQPGNRSWLPQPPPQHIAQPAPQAAPVKETDASGRTWLGMPKILWAVFLNVIAMLVFIACIPFILTIAKRRRMQPSQSMPGGGGH